MLSSVKRVSKQHLNINIWALPSAQAFRYKSSFRYAALRALHCNPYRLGYLMVL